MIIKTAIPIDLTHQSWQTTYAKRIYSSHYGYGKINAGLMIEKALKFNKVNQQTVFETKNIKINQEIPESNVGLITSIPINALSIGIDKIEHVQVTITIDHPRRSDLEIYLTSPQIITSKLISSRPDDNSSLGFQNYTLMTLAHW